MDKGNRHVEHINVMLYDDAASALSAGNNSNSTGVTANSSSVQPRSRRRVPPPENVVIRTDFRTNDTAEAKSKSAANGGRSSLPRNSNPTILKPIRGSSSASSSSPLANFRAVDSPPYQTGSRQQHAQSYPSHQPIQPRKDQHAVAAPSNLIAIFFGMVVGIAVGVVFQRIQVNKNVLVWVEVPGKLYIQAIKCIVLPLVFVNLSVSVADVISIGKANVIGKRVSMYFCLLTLLACIEGIGMGFGYRHVVNQRVSMHDPDDDAVFTIQCGSTSKYLAMQPDGKVACSEATTQKSNAAITKFIAFDVLNNLKRAKDHHLVSGNLTDNLIALLNLLVPKNIMNAFITNETLSVVAFAIPCGVAIAKSFVGPSSSMNPILEFLRELNDTLISMVNWVIYFTPIAVFSLLAANLGKNFEFDQQSPIQQTLMIMGLLSIALFLHCFMVLPIIYVIVMRSNPFKFIGCMGSAFVYALGCSSSVATLPLSVKCVESTRMISHSVCQFVMSIGGMLHMNGTAIYLTTSVFYLAETYGFSEELTPFRCAVLALAAFMGSISTAPVPSGGLMMLGTVWRIALPDRELPEMYDFLVAADVVLNRLVTVTNIYGDAMVCRIIAEQVDETVNDAYGQEGESSMHAYQ